MNKEAAFQAWAEGFDIPAYAENAVPEDAEEPYMTYYFPTAMFGDGEQAATLNLWYRTTSEAEPNSKAREIGKALARGGAIAMDSGDNAVKRRYINISIEFVTNY